MSFWNYRILRHRNPLPKWMLLKKNKKYREKYHPEDYIEWFAIHEVYYDENGKPRMATEEPIKVVTDKFTKEEFNRVLRWMRLSINKPVLDAETLKEIDETVKPSDRSHKKCSTGKRISGKDGVSSRVKKN